ncbi:hypothetical protein AMJ49_01640 [Parcubacteria bacterium DG_74_2]|nr:MAG: hypothetical protein AMJ49_01640 [Parcubacteria bacterium DG_74_2]
MLKELINQYYSDKQRDKEQHHFYITDAGRCGRQIFFKFKNVPREEIEARVLRMFDHGDYIHQLIMRPLHSIRDIHVIASEINVPPLELVRGRADAIISDGKESYVVDIKSMNSMIFKSLDDPKEENVNQLQLYLHFFKIKKGILLYVNKDTQELKEFLINYDSVLAQNLLNEFIQLKKKIDSDTIPQRILGWPDNWQCKYCQFFEICGMAGAGEINWEKFKRKIEEKN